ncbi:hypothetical protein [Streptomyces fumanus]|uniref:Uncharacterized protein n=1 Tax=Streptomyces fumanus TaxID=67302 RepID=A0A919ATF7_9ACTN|nr:hypothetical protein [Streptomyces fumanus]GHF24479.1 hypothetical protein GCM10018772_57770 [Streptomyces fumanus]
MKKLLEFLGFVAVVQGAAGLLHEFTDWRVGFVQQLAFLDGREVYASVALVVLGLALFVAAESRASG